MRLNFTYIEPALVLKSLRYATCRAMLLRAEKEQEEKEKENNQ